ncbi:MAG TPA: hypothetical protein VFP13_06240 [Actinomycetota bacterium]|nr:hypothetical protein [Actinomycetota bacterium]
MRRSLVALSLALVLSAAPAHAKLVDLTASPNPAALGTQVRHSVSLGAPARLEVYVSAVGFERPGTGTLPPGSWTYRCCPGQTAGTPAWHYRSNSGVAPGSYRFGAVARARGWFLSTAVTTVGSEGVWIRIT